MRTRIQIPIYLDPTPSKHQKSIENLRHQHKKTKKYPFADLKTNFSPEMRITTPENILEKKTYDDWNQLSKDFPEELNGGP